MVRSFACLAVLAFFSARVAVAEEKAKQPAETPAAAAPASEAPGWIPRELHGTHAAKRLVQIQTELEAAVAKRGVARQEADKARAAAIQAEVKADDLKRLVTHLEAEKMRVWERSLAQAHEDAQQKLAFETSQKVSRLEAQLRDMTDQMARLRQQQKDQAAAASSPVKQAKHVKPNAGEKKEKRKAEQK